MDRKDVTATADPSRSGASEGPSRRGAARAPARRESDRVCSDPACSDAACPASLATSRQPSDEPEHAQRPSFDQVYEAHFDFVWRSLRLLGIADEALEDATQDTFSVVSQQLAGFEGRSTLRTWLFAILQRVASNHRRKRRRKQRPLIPFADAAGHEPTPLAHIEAAEAARTVESFCAALDPERRALFLLAVLEDVPAAEVASSLDLPIGKVYSRVHTLRAGLKRALARRGAGDV
jgi:RNA polymerase sigma-70 factor (ECF subfamily)